jgi:LuxR family transcriptional regulator, maltose regulon positive regulatory protein
MAFSGAEASRRTPFTILESRLAPPRLCDGTIERTEIVNRLRLTPPADVALIVAPAGYGKTSVLAELHRRPGKRPFAWLSIDERDNDPVTFLTYLTLTLNRIGACDRQVVEALARPRSSLTTIRARLQRSLEAAGPFGLILDDLHLLTAAKSVEIVRRLVDDLPSDGRLVLASRTEPPLPLGALRKRGRLVELGIDDLRLTEEETGLLLRRTGLTTSDGEVAEVAALTEGWPAGVYLAALATIARDDRGPLTAFRGSDRFVSDYVRAEHLAYLPEDDVAFMTRVSALDRMSGPLCDAVLQQSGSAASLERLAQTNLFLIPLGEESPPVYRFQRLFREALEAELRRAEPGLAETLAARASVWCEGRGDTESAVEYAWAAADQDRFASLLERFVLPLYYAGRLATIDRWLALVDHVLLERHPALAAGGALVHGLEGREDKAERWAAVAERAPAGTTTPDGSPVTAWTAMLRAAMCRSGVDQMRRDAELSISALADESLWRPAALLLLGIAHVLAGDNAAADEILVRAYAAATAANATEAAGFALAERSLLAGADDRWATAELLVVEAREALRDAHLCDYATSALTYAASASSAAQHGDWVRARADLRRMEQLLPTLSRAFPWLGAQVRIEAARARLVLSDVDGAASLLAEAQNALARGPDLGVLSEQADGLARELASRRPQGGDWEHLTPAERRLLPLLTTHLTFREIADHLHVSRNTVKTQAICTYRKLGASSRSEAIQRAIDLGLMEPSDVLEPTRPL